jgi:phosphotransferase system IIA component
MVGTLRVPSTVTAVSSGGISDIRAAMSWTFSSRLTVGAAIHVFPGQNHIVFGRAFPSDTTLFGAFAQTSTFNFSGSAVSFGLIATPIDHVNLGVSGRYGFSMHVHEGDSTTVGEANVPNRLSVSGAFDGITGTILSVRYGTEKWSAMRGLGSAGLSVFDATEFSAGLETGGPRIGAIPMAVRLGYRARQLPFGVGAQQVSEKEFTGGLGIPLASGRTALDLSIAHALRSANVGLSETGWIFSLGIAIKPY